MLTRPELKAAVAHLAEQEVFAFDVETNGLDVRKNWVTWIGLASFGQVYLIPTGHRVGRVIVPAYTEKVLPPDDERAILKSGKLSERKIERKVPAVHAPVPAQLDTAVVFRELEPLFFGDQTKVAFNARFDLSTIAKYYGGVVPSPPYEDPMVMTHILNENRRNYELKEITLDWLSIQGLSERRKFYPKLGKTIQTEPIDAVARYLAKDAYLMWLYWKEAHRALEREGMLGLLKLEMDLYPALIRMHNHGVAVDLGRMDHIGGVLESQIDVLKKRAWTIAGEPFALTNNNVKRDLLFKPKSQNGQGLRPLKKTPKTQAPVLDAYTLDHYAPTNKLAAVFAEFAEVSKLHSTYIMGIKNKVVHRDDGADIVYTSFTQHRTVTGRLSSVEPNLHNIPRESEIRALFVAPPGHQLVVCDYDQIELRVFAHFTGDPVMKGIFERGEDIHSATAAFVLGKPMDQLSKEERTTGGKTINFAVSYGAGIGRLMAAGIPEDRAKALLERYFRRFATILPWRRQVLLEAYRRGDRADPRRHPPYVTTLLGRRRRLPDLYSPDREFQSRAERQAWNHRIQGTAAEIMKIAMIKVDRAFLGTPFKMLLTVHDELISIAPDDRAEECRDVMSAAMSGIMLGEQPIISVPLVVSCGVATRWSETKG